jgi:hypothetical protein
VLREVVADPRRIDIHDIEPMVASPPRAGGFLKITSALSASLLPSPTSSLEPPLRAH